MRGKGAEGARKPCPHVGAQGRGLGHAGADLGAALGACRPSKLRFGAKGLQAIAPWAFQ